MEKILKRTAKEIMTKKVIAVQKDESIKELFKLLDKNGILGVPVVDGERKVVGVITETDLIQHFTTLETPRSVNLLGGIVYLDNIADFNEQLKEHCAETVEELLTEPATTVREDTTLQEILDIMSEQQITRLPVVDKKDKLTGIITRTDILHQLAKINKI